MEQPQWLQLNQLLKTLFTAVRNGTHWLWYHLQQLSFSFYATRSGFEMKNCYLFLVQHLTVTLAWSDIVWTLYKGINSKYKGLLLQVTSLSVVE